MAVKKIPSYQTSDGKLFTDLDKANAYELAATRVAQFRRVFANPTLSIQIPSTLASDLFSKPELVEELRTACNAVLDYHRRYGKLKPTS